MFPRSTRLRRRRARRLLSGNRLNQERQNQLPPGCNWTSCSFIPVLGREKLDGIFSLPGESIYPVRTWPPDKIYSPQCTFRRKFIVHAIRWAQYPLRIEGTTIGFAVSGRKVSTASYNEFRNVNNSCFSCSVSSLKRRDTCSASPLCRSMAFSRVNDRRSCM
jgi:hypothetical protein